MEDHYENEALFEEDLIRILVENKGWKDGVVEYLDEEGLLQNWADILLRNNPGRDQLNGIALSKGELAQLMEQVRAADTPYKANRLIKGGSLHIRRDNPDDPEHLGQTVYLKLFAPEDTAGGSCFYQIARQPRFTAREQTYPNRRGDFMLLINGMPVIHVELKSSRVPWTDALHQIELYTNEGVFQGLFGLVQIFVCMTPEETRYFANPGREGLTGQNKTFNRKLVFTWEDENNRPVEKWHQVAERLLSIPMAHEMIASYTVADAADGHCLKILRSYQHAAVSAIIKKLQEARGVWGFKRPEGGFVWHTTGSGKTLTSFTAAQLAARSKLVDKSVFLVDRIELGTQSLREYTGFADEREEINNPVNARELKELLLDKKDHTKTLILSSINKLDKVAKEQTRKDELDEISRERIAIIIDECHRSTFGQMMRHIKQAFPNAMLIGFTGTPITKENPKEGSVTADVFGKCLAKYTLADGIRDGNVLGLQLSKVETFAADDLRRAVALEKARSKNEEEAFADPQRKKAYLEYMDATKHPMAGFTDEDGKYRSGIEDLVPTAQYDTDAHREHVVRDIKKRWGCVTQGGRLHALLATSSISEAMEYYHLIKREIPQIAATCIFDPSLDNVEGNVVKEDMLVELLDDYSKRYGTCFSITDHASFKADAAARMAHKKPYEHVDREPDEKLDLIIVVNQLLTGYDSKWLGVLFMDKYLEYENVIQAFSRTNRNLDADKTCGIIRYYRRVHSMDRNIRKAIDLYSDGTPVNLVVKSICENIETINSALSAIAKLFETAGVPDFSRLPDSDSDKAMFCKQFTELGCALRASQVQGFTFEEAHYECEDFLTGETRTADCELAEEVYETLKLRYSELPKQSPRGKNPVSGFDIDPTLAVLDTTRIDRDYVNKYFQTAVKSIDEGKPEEDIQNALDDLHSAYPHLPADEQSIVERVIAGIRTGELETHDSWTCADYTNHIREKDFRKQVDAAAGKFGIKGEKLSELVSMHPSADNINEYGRFDDILADIDIPRAKQALETMSGHEVKTKDVKRTVDAILRRFILKNGCDITAAVKEELEEG